MKARMLLRLRNRLKRMLLKFRRRRKRMMLRLRRRLRRMTSGCKKTLPTHEMRTQIRAKSQQRRSH